MELSSDFSIGRNPMCDLVLHDTMLSRRHFRVEFDGQGWFVEDMESKNGTWKEEKAISREILCEGDVICAGRYSFEFHERMAEGAKRYCASRMSRPADPHEALQGTIHGMMYAEAEESMAETGVAVQRKRPRPIPMPTRMVGLLEEAEGGTAVSREKKKLPIMLELPDEYDLQPTGETVRRPAAPGGTPAPEKKKGWWRVWTGWRVKLNLDLAAFVLILALLAVGLYAIAAYIPHW